MWRPAKRIFIEENDREAKKREGEREAKRSNGGNNTIAWERMYIFWGEITAVFQQLSEPFLRADKWRPWSPIPAKTVRFASVRTQTGGGRGRGEKGRRPARRARGYNASRGIIFYRINGLWTLNSAYHAGDLTWIWRNVILT